jgi:hypothetical protein
MNAARFRSPTASLPHPSKCGTTGWMLAASLAVVALGAAGCRKNPELASKPGASAAPSNASTSPRRSQAEVGIPAPSASVARTVNPVGVLPYAGPTGTVRGVVRVAGDVAPARVETLPKVPADCAGATDFYGKLFREGPGRTLADVLIAVTDYGQNYLPAPGPSHRIAIRDCAWESRTVVLTFGQDITVSNAGQKPHVPELMGANSPARLVSIPGGDPVKLYPMKPGHYQLIDMMNIFMEAEVFVLKYATHAVTGLDGRYTISGLPAQEVTVSAFSPQAELVEQRKVRLSPGQTTEVDFTLSFDEKKRAAASAPPAAASSPPTASGTATFRRAPPRPAL